jgi:hypothetical protein
MWFKLNFSMSLIFDKDFANFGSGGSLMFVIFLGGS